MTVAELRTLLSLTVLVSGGIHPDPALTGLVALMQRGGRARDTGAAEYAHT